ncbi:MAG: hypothetical protein ACJ8E9_04425 [Sphingomicrobium sp.]
MKRRVHEPLAPADGVWLTKKRQEQSWPLSKLKDSIERQQISVTAVVPKRQQIEAKSTKVINWLSSVALLLGFLTVLLDAAALPPNSTPRVCGLQSRELGGKNL